MVTFDASELESVTRRLPAGAGVDRVTGNALVCPTERIVPEGNPMDPPPPTPVTVTLSVTGGTFATPAVAVIVVVPGARPEIRNCTPPEFWIIVAVGGTVATPGLLEVRVSGTPPAGAGTERAIVTDWLAPAAIVMGPERKFSAAPTCTVPVPAVYPTADALMTADPKLTAETCGWTKGWVCPARIVMEACETVALLVSLLTNATVRLLGVAEGSVMVSGVDWPGESDAEDTPMAPEFCTFTLAVACVTLGALARITADPGLTPVTGMRTVVAPAAKDTVGGTVAAVLLDSTFAVKPPVGAGPDNVRVRFWVEPLGRLMAGGVNVKAPTTVTA
jgi:hypothetical protein